MNLLILGLIILIVVAILKKVIGFAIKFVYYAAIICVILFILELLI